MEPSRVPAEPAEALPLKAVLFDSGGVLMRPIGGRWLPRADFEPTVLRHDPAITAERFAAAFTAGERYMTAAGSTPDIDRYHVVVLQHLGLLPAPDLRPGLPGSLDATRRRWPGRRRSG